MGIEIPKLMKQIWEFFECFAQRISKRKGTQTNLMPKGTILCSHSPVTNLVQNLLASMLWLILLVHWKSIWSRTFWRRQEEAPGWANGRKRMAEFISFLSNSVLDEQCWESFRPKLEKSMKKKCKFYYNKVVKHSGNWGYDTNLKSFQHPISSFSFLERGYLKKQFFCFILHSHSGFLIMKYIPCLLRNLPNLTPKTAKLS